MRSQSSDQLDIDIMHRRLFKYISVLIVCLTGFATRSEAQFKEEAFSQTYNDQSDSTARADTTDKLFSFKDWAGGITHKQKIDIGTMFAGSVIMPGTAQIYNKDYWKLPIIYGGIGALAGTGGYKIHQYKKSQKALADFEAAKLAFENEFGQTYPHQAPVLDTKSKNMGTWLLAGAGLVYWGSLLDGAISYESDKEPLPGRATLYSALLPGLGQIYNGELFKVPIYWGCLMGSVYFLTNNNTNYKRFKRIQNEASQPDNNSPINAETAKYYRDVYRRYRDYSIVATAAFYLLQVLDANVFAYMHDFEVSEDLTMDISPAVLPPDNAYALHNTSPSRFSDNAFGLRVGFRF